MDQKKKDSLLAELDAIDQAVLEESRAKRMPDEPVYVHTFDPPFVFENHTFSTLRFDWGCLTAKDSLAIENDMLRSGKALVIPAYSGEYLTGMAVLACTERNSDGNRVVDKDAIHAMPMRDYLTIHDRARRFLLHSGSSPATGDPGSGSNA